MLLFLLRRPMCFILHLVCLFMKMHLPALLQGNCLDLVRCAFLRKLSGCILSTPEAEVDKIGRFGRFYTDIPIPIYLYIDDISIYRYRYIYISMIYRYTDTDIYIGEISARCIYL